MSLFNSKKLKDLFNNTEKKDLKKIDKTPSFSTVNSINVLSNLNSVYDVALCAKISHGFKLDPHYVKQEEFISKLMGYGHDSISAHSNIQVFIVVQSNENSQNDLINSLGGLKYMNIHVFSKSKIVSVNDDTSLSKIQFVMIGLSIRALRYYFLNTYKNEDTELSLIMKNIAYSYTSKIFYPDIIKMGILDESKFSYYPVISQKEDIEDQWEKDQDNEDKLITWHKDEIKKGNVTFIDYASKDDLYDSEKSLSNTVKSIIANELSKGNMEDSPINISVETINEIYDAIIKTGAIVFKIDKMSRAISQQINRHDFGITQASQRYIDSSNLDFIDSTDFNNKYNTDDTYKISFGGKEFEFSSKELGEEIIKLYPQLINQGMLKQDARSYLPMNVETSAYYTATLQNLIHFINIREDKAAQPEVQEIAHNIRFLLMKVLNDLDKDLANYVNGLFTNEETTDNE